MFPTHVMGIPTGGPAFPRSASIDPSDGTLPDGDRLIDAYDGMSLREWFAGHALIGMLAARHTGPRPDETVSQFRGRMARVSYGYADALLVARGLPRDDGTAQARSAEKLQGDGGAPPARTTGGDQ